MTPYNCDGKSIPIRCMIEVLVKDDQGCNGEAVEKESFAIVPSTTLFKDVVKTVLLKLGYSSQDISNAKGAVQIKNWRALDLEQVTDNALVSVEDMLGDLTTVATLRIRITRAGRTEDVKDKLLLMLLGQSYDSLQKRGCPIAKEDLESIIAGQKEITVDTQNTFYSWYRKQLQSSVSKTNDLNCSSTQSYSTPLCATARAARLRISFDSEEVSRLQKWFEQDPHPSRQQMTAFLHELNSLPARMALKPLDLTNIMYWFKNARAAARRNGRSITSDDLSDDEDKQSEKEGSTSSAPPLPNSNAVYQIKNPLGSEDEARNEDDESDMEDLSVTDDEELGEESQHTLPQATSERDSPDQPSSKAEKDDASNNNAVKTKATSSSSPHAPTSFMNMASRLPGYPFPYGALPMAYLQSQMTHMGPFYKDWSEKVQSAVAQAQANTAQQNMAIVKNECELSKAERQKRHRAFIDPVSEIPKLEQWFTKDTHPSHYVIEQICEDLNRGEFRSRYPKLSPKNIQLWFKNHRAKVKRMRVGGGNLSLSFNNMGSPTLSPPPSGLSISAME